MTWNLSKNKTWANSTSTTITDIANTQDKITMKTGKQRDKMQSHPHTTMLSRIVIAKMAIIMMANQMAASDTMITRGNPANMVIVRNGEYVYMLKK